MMEFLKLANTNLENIHKANSKNKFAKWYINMVINWQSCIRGWLVYFTYQRVTNSRWTNWSKMLASYNTVNILDKIPGYFAIV